MSPISANMAEIKVYKPAFKKIDILSCENFSSELRSFITGKTRIILDLSDTRFIDSSGLSKIVACLRTIRENGGEMRICGVQAPVMTLFTMVRLGEIIGIDADVEASVRQFEEGGKTGSSVPGK